jgi:hypothetical protein
MAEACAIVGRTTLEWSVPSLREWRMLKPKLPGVPGVSISVGVPTPELPQVPTAPTKGDLLRAAGVPEMPEMPEAPHVPTAAELAAAAGMPAIPQPGVPAELQELMDRREAGTITDEDFAAAMQKLYGG